MSYATKITFVTGFVKSLPRTSNSVKLEYHDSVLKYHTKLKFLHPLSYVGAHYSPDFNAVASANLAL